VRRGESKTDHLDGEVRWASTTPSLGVGRWRNYGQGWRKWIAGGKQGEVVVTNI
jgi:hypothetical protein